MVQVIELLDGSIHTIIGEMDLLSLVEQKMGLEVRMMIEEMMSNPSEEQKLDEIRAHFKGVMGEIYEQSKVIAGLIQKRDIDRQALSTAAGKIGVITWRELNAVSAT